MLKRSVSESTMSLSFSGGMGVSRTRSIPRGSRASMWVVSMSGSVSDRATVSSIAPGSRPAWSPAVRIGASRGGSGGGRGGGGQGGESVGVGGGGKVAVTQAAGAARRGVGATADHDRHCPGGGFGVADGVVEPCVGGLDGGDVLAPQRAHRGEVVVVAVAALG